MLLHYRLLRIYENCYKKFLIQRNITKPWQSTLNNITTAIFYRRPSLMDKNVLFRIMSNKTDRDIPS